MAHENKNRLFDQHGKGIRRTQVAKRQATPSLTGVRQMFDESVVCGLTPQKLAGILRAAAQNEPYDYLTLAMEMEERDLHYGAELSKRKLAVTSLPITVEAVDDSPEEIRIAAAVRRNIAEQSGLRVMLKDCMDGIGKGFSVVDIDWNITGTIKTDQASIHGWKPRSYEWIDQRWFQFDQIDRKTIRMRDESDLQNGIPLEPYRHIIHVPKIKSGIPIRGGIAYFAAWAWMFKNYSVKDWLAFGEVYGMPLRLGKYHAAADEDDIAVLKQAVAGLGIDAAAVFPTEMEIELVQIAQAAGSQEFFRIMADYFDKQVSIGILGQTATTEGTAGGLGNEDARADVREDIRDDDAEQLEDTIHRDVVIPFVDLNFGTREDYPRIQIRAVDAEDLKKWTESVTSFVDRGLKVDQKEVRERLSVSEPEKNAAPETLLHPVNHGPTVTPDEPAATATNSHHQCNCGQAHHDHVTALNQATDEATTIDGNLQELVEDGLDDWQEQIAPLVQPIRVAASEAENYADFLEVLDSEENWEAMDHNNLVDDLSPALSSGDLLGREGE